MPKKGYRQTDEHKKKIGSALLGDMSYNWKGGRVIRRDGYVMVKKYGHPRENKNHYVLEHILVMENRIGRHLLENEIVHHINEIKADNRPENLEIINKTVHPKIHYQKLAKESMVKIGVLYQSGNMTQKEIGKIFGVDNSTISRYINKKRIPVV